MKKVGNDDIQEICLCCEYAVPIKESDVCVCVYKGAVGSSDTCRKFKLDLLKLTPRARVLPEDDGTIVIDI